MNPVPSEIQRTDGGVTIIWRDGHRSVFGYALLRRACPCAECTAKPPHVVTEDNPLRLISDVPIRAQKVVPAGNYALQFYWNDGHSAGLYTFNYLRKLCPCRTCQDG